MFKNVFLYSERGKRGTRGKQGKGDGDGDGEWGMGEGKREGEGEGEGKGMGMGTGKACARGARGQGVADGTPLFLPRRI